MFVSVTRLTVKSWRFIPAFAWHTLRSQMQIRSAPGFLGGYTAGTADLTFWTVTSWNEVSAMKAYRNSGAHVTAMPMLIRWCCEASVASYENDCLPEIDEAAAQLKTLGRLSKVRDPSEAQKAGLTLPSQRLPTFKAPVTPRSSSR